MLEFILNFQKQFPIQNKTAPYHFGQRQLVQFSESWLVDVMGPVIVSYPSVDN